MGECREIDALVTLYVDGEISPGERAAVDQHLAACPPCRHRAAVEAAIRRVVRTRLEPPGCAPAALRARCLAIGAAAAPQALLIRRSRFLTSSLAAAGVLALSGILLYALTLSSPTVLAAQLALDHVKCFALFGWGAAYDAPAGRAVEDRLDRQYGWRAGVQRTALPGLELVQGRTCLYGEGPLAHLMYRLQGRPISLFMLPDTARAPAAVAAFGHEAVIWSGEGRTYVLLGREPRPELERIAAYLKGQ